MTKLIKYQQGKKLVRTPNGAVVDITPYYGRSGYEKYSKMADEYQPRENPEYASFIKGLASYRQSSNSNMNWKYLANQLPEGYTIDDNGIVYDSDGNAYINTNGLSKNNKYVLNTDNPLIVTFNQGNPIERNETFYRVNTPDKYINENILNVVDKNYYKDAINEYVKNNSIIVPFSTSDLIIDGNRVKNTGRNDGLFITRHLTKRPSQEDIKNNVHVNSISYIDSNGNQVEFHNGGKLIKKYQVGDNIIYQGSVAKPIAVTAKGNSNYTQLRDSYKKQGYSEEVAQKLARRNVHYVNRVGNRTNSVVGAVGKELGYFTPYVGQAMFAADIINDATDGNIKGAVGNAALALGLGATSRLAGKVIRKGLNKAINHADKIDKRIALNNALKEGINNATKNGNIEVDLNDLQAPGKWFRITETPEVGTIKETGKNWTTTDMSSADDFYSHSEADRQTKLALKRLKNKTNKFGLSLVKNGSAHGNKSQGSYGTVWNGSVAKTKEYPQIILEGNAPTIIPASFKDGKRLSRTTFIEQPSENLPIGTRIGFSTGQMPIEGLKQYQRLDNGKYQYLGEVLPYKTIPVENTPTNFSLPSSTLQIRSLLGKKQGSKIKYFQND